jgi:hypothetical protein
LNSTSGCDNRLVVWLACAALLSACAAHRATPEPPTLENAAYIDLKPGWRLRVVTPILKSGGYQLRTSAAETRGDSTAVSAPEFIGFETAYYAVSNAADGGVRIELLSAAITKGEHISPHLRPVVPLFGLPAGIRWVRLLYLTRSSQADHDMALVASDQKQTLDAFTSEVQSDPGTCQARRGLFCTWVPAGIAVRPELQKPGSAEWIPAR